MDAEQARDPMTAAEEILGTPRQSNRAMQLVDRLCDSLQCGRRGDRRTYCTSWGGRTTSERKAVVSWLDTARRRGALTHPDWS